MLSVERPFDRRLEFGAGGGGFCGLLTNPNLSDALQSEDMTSLFPKIHLRASTQTQTTNIPIGITDLPELESLLGERLCV